LALDYVNIHWHEPLKPENIPDAAAPGVLVETADYLRSAAGKEIW